MNKIKLIYIFLVIAVNVQSQFVDSFDGQEIEGWFAFTGDGAAKIKLEKRNSFLRIHVDATRDKYNVWWAVTKRNVAHYMDLNKLKDTDYEVRVEARVRVGNAPRRVNMMVNTQRTTDFHKDLMEFDIPDTSAWHVISMTTRALDAVPGDSLYVQLNVIDWGSGQYYVDMDYYRADIINIKNADPDIGAQVPYHPPVPSTDFFSKRIPAAHDALINLDFPEVNFNNWQVRGMHGINKVLTVNASQWAILRWDFSEFKNTKIKGTGLLELTTHSVFKGGKYEEALGEDLGMEFGKIRIIEILDGAPFWDQETVTLNNLILGKDLTEVFNSQMIFDANLLDEAGSKNHITISNPVMQRLINGRTKGILIRPLGAISASFYALEDKKTENAAALYFNIEEKQ